MSRSDVFDEGDAAALVYFLCSGLVRNCVAAQNGKFKTLVDVKVGEVFGEVALLENRPHRAFAIALETSVVLEILRGEFMRHLDAADPIMKSVVNHLFLHLRDEAH